MRIAHLDTGRTWRGGQAQVLLLARELAALGHEQLLLAPPGPLLERAVAAGIAVHAWRSRGELDAGAMLAARAALGRFRPDVAHLHSAHAHALGAWPARGAGARAVIVSRRIDLPVAGGVFGRLKYGRAVDLFVCVSEAVRRTMLASGIDAARLAVVPSGIDADAVRADAAAGDDLRAWLDLPADAEIVGTVGSLGPDKNHALLLAAAPRVLAARPHARFVWLGEGECRAALERQRAALGLADVVRMPGFDPRAHAHLARFDLFALSSRIEGLCTSLLDAQVLGVPIVATAVGGVPEVVRDGVSGRLVPGGDATALADAIVEALASPERRAAWVAAGRDAVAAHTAAAMARATLAAYEGVLAAREARESKAFGGR